jgi:nucleoside-diphosphate-sugar epimerase
LFHIQISFLNSSASLSIMGSQNYPLRSSGIYHNLPQFDISITNLTAIITGAWGISGFGMLRALLDSPQRWSKIYTVSRSPPPPSMLSLLPLPLHSRIQHIPCDFVSSSSAQIASALKDAKVTADYVFYYSYLQPRPEPGAPAWSNESQLVAVNAGMLSTFLEALPLAGITPKRFLLQTGGKHYGPHIGRARVPCLESDPQPRHLAPNFYYDQEDLLFEFCKKHGVGWNVIRPPWIIGATTAAQMNAFYPFAVYAAVAAERGVPLTFNSTWAVWQDDAMHSTARLTGYLSEWAVLEEKCKDEAFNSQDTSPLSWDRLWEELIRWFGVKEGFVPPKEDESEMIEFSIGGGKKTPMGYGPPGVTRFAFTMLSWAKDPENAKAWRGVMQKHGLTSDAFEDVEGNFTFADATFVMGGPLSMNKVSDGP